MTPEEAIKILQYQGPPENGPTIQAFVQAKKLGLEALKRIFLQREHPKRKFPTLLSGETI